MCIENKLDEIMYGRSEDIMDLFIERRINEDNERMGETASPALVYIGKTRIGTGLTAR